MAKLSTQGQLVDYWEKDYVQIHSNCPHWQQGAGCSHWNGPRLQFHELNRKQAASTKLHQYVIENKQTM